MINKYSSIEDFLNCETNCFFCDKPLQRRITHFRHDDLPIINAPVRDNAAIFSFRHTTPTFDLQVKGKIDTKTNVITFTCEDSSGFTDDDMPTFNRNLARQVFSSMLPHAQLYCNCKYCYTVASDVFKVKQSEPDDIIKPVDFFYESFVLGNLWVQNDYSKGKTYIYARNKGDSAITCPIIDWKAMGHEKLLTRIKTLVVFS